MVDHTKWDTEQVIQNGVLERTAPKDRVPADAKLTDLDEEDGSEEKIRGALLDGGVRAYMYYGCFKVWKDGDAYSGQLMQYRNETGRFDKVSLDEALKATSEWWEECWG